MIPLSTIIAAIILGLGLLAIHAVARTVIKLFIDFKPETKTLVKPFYKEEYFCNNGHSLGTQKPPPGRLCDQCIAEGLTTATCSECKERGLEQQITFIDKIPPYRYRCQRCHRIITPTVFEVEGRRVTYEQWVEHHTVDEPQPVFVPENFQLAPVPTQANQVARIVQALAGLEEIKRAVDTMEKIRDRRIAELEDKMRRRQLEYRTIWVPGNVLLSLLSILFIYAYALSNVRITLSLNEAIDTIVWATKSMLELLAIILVVYLILRFAFRWVKPEETKSKINKEVLTFLLATFISVVLIPLIFGVPITLMDIFQGFAFDIIAEAAAVLLVSINLFKVLRRARDNFRELNFDDIRRRLNGFSSALLMRF